MTPEVLAILKKLTPENLKYLAHLVDEDTTGDQDDSLYVLFMAAYNLCDDKSDKES